MSYNLVVYIYDGSQGLARGLWSYNGYTSLAIGTVETIFANLTVCGGNTPQETALNIFKRIGGQPANGKEPIVSEPIYEAANDEGSYSDPWGTEMPIAVDISSFANPTVQLGLAFGHKRLQDMTKDERDSIMVFPPDGPEAVAFDLALSNSPMGVEELHELEYMVTAAQMDSKKAIAIAGAEERDDLLLLKEWW